MKKQNGITLIALVITIIVLLILAGVSISAITGENGIVEKAKDAREKTKKAEQEELETLGGLEDWINTSTENLEPSEPDPTFPYGTYYAMQDADASYGYVIYDNGVVEEIVVEGDIVSVISTSGTGYAVVEGTSIKLDESVEATLSTDYSTLTIDSTVFNKTNTIFTYCVHTWDESDDTEIGSNVHQCTECYIYGIHNFEITATTHTCQCGLSECHTYFGSVCEVCEYGCSHNNTTVTKVNNDVTTHKVQTICSDCNQIVSEITENHIISATYTDNTDGTHTLTEICSECSATSTTSEAHSDTDSSGNCDLCNSTISTTTNLITFTIDGIEYQAEEGMTWGKWIEDEELNTASCFLTNTLNHVHKRFCEWNFY